MKEKKNISPKIKIILLIAAAVFLVAGVTLAWFIFSNGGISEAFGLGNFEIKSEMYFMKDDEKISCDDFIDEDTGTVNLSLDENDDNYIKNFRTDVLYKGKGYGYIRAKVVVEFDIDSSVVSAPTKVPFILGSQYDEETGGNQNAWFDNRYGDLCYYYANSVTAGTNTGFTTLNLINGINDTDDEIGFDLESLKQSGNTSVFVGIETDMVQINRYPQLWKINELPWENY